MPPYRRKGYKRSYGRSRSTSRRRRPMGGSFMKRAKTRAYANLRTGGLLAIERKFSDLAYPETGLGGAGSGIAPNGILVSTFSPPLVGPTVYRGPTGVLFTVNTSALNVLGTGDSGSDRDGRQVINDSIHLRGQCNYAGATNFALGDASASINIVLVLDTQTNGAAPAGSSVFVNPGDTSAGAGPSACAAGPFVNLANSKRFRILKHVRRVLMPAINGNAVASYASGTFMWSMDVPLKGMKTNYVADTALATTVSPATVASIGDNGIFLFAWSDVGGVNLAYNSRLRFRG